MKLNRFSAALGVIAALAVGVATVDAAYVVKDQTGASLTFASYVTSFVHWPAHIMGGLFGGVPTPVNMTNSGQLDVNCITGCTGSGGAATSANQTTANTSLASLVTNTTGVSTAANQTTANGYLSTLATAALDTVTPSSTKPGCGSSCTSGVTAAMTGTTSTLLLAAPSTGLRNYLTAIVCGNSHATVGTFVDIQDGSGGTVIFALPAGSVFNGSVVTLPTPLKQPTTATGLYVVDETTGASVKCAGVGYTAA